MSELVPSVIPLDKGLNLQTAKIVAPAGSVLDTVNYEQVDFQGQKRIDGYARYDGSLLPALDEYYVLSLDILSGQMSEGSLLTTADGAEGIIGVILSASGTALYLAPINFNILPQEGDIIYGMLDGNLDAGATVVSVSTGSASGVTPDEHYNLLLSLTASLRSRVESLPGRIAGLHWFRDRLYAVADVAVVSAAAVGAVNPNDNVMYNGEQSRVLDVYDSMAYLSSMSTFNLEAVPADSIASFYESRTEQQVMTEDSGSYDFGWRFKHLGWEVAFENGVSLFGSLPSLNQNLSGIGVQGPTSTEGDNGRPLALYQDVELGTSQEQVNGWKSSNTPNSYNLDPNNVRTGDSLYIYADAFISWDGTTGVVTAEGITTPDLIEYPATNTVEITL